jgi:PAS domain S-box-containing protein
MVQWDHMISLLLGFGAGVLFLYLLFSSRTRQKPGPSEQRGDPPGASDELHRLMFEGNPLPMMVYDLDTLAILAVNDAAAAHYGYSPQEFLSLTIKDIRPPEDIPALLDLVSNLRSGFSQSGRWRHRKKDGSLSDVVITSHAVMFRGRPARFVLVNDITEQKRAVEALRRSEEKYRDLFENANDAIFIVDSRYSYVDANKKAVELLGYSREELLRMSILDLVPPEQVSRSEAELDKLRGAGSYEKFVGKIRTRDGRWLDVEVSSSAIMDNGQVIGSRDIMRDITDRKKAEEALRTSEERYRLLFESNPHPMWVYDLETLAFLAVNDAAVRHYGYSRDEFLAMTLKDIRPPEDVPALVENVSRVTEGLDEAGVWRHRKKDGMIIDVEITSHTLAFAGRRAEIVLAHDVTERRRMEAELLKAQKLESLGVLAGGLAHDFNNLLTAVMGNISLAKLHSQAGDGVSERLQEAEKASFRARDLTQQLLTFAKGGVPVKRTVSLPGLIKEAAGFALRGSRSMCEFFLPPDLCAVEADEGQLSQVIHNLIINADQAMPAGGTISVRGENVTIGPGDGLALHAGTYVKLSVQDRGIGIPREHFTRIFDPYFTTKQKGSGLGLATTYSIIKRHDGQITVESDLGAGAVFHIYLPAAGRCHPEAEPEEARPARGTGRILVMDDEEMIRDVAGKVLAGLGYEVGFAADGEKAVELYAAARGSGRPFDAVIMDLTIPGGTGGREAIEKLRAIDPGVRAIVSSGYSNDPVMARFRDFGFRGVVSKPYTAASLAEAVKKALAEK